MRRFSRWRRWRTLTNERTADPKFSPWWEFSEGGVHREGEGPKKVELRERKSGRKIEPCGRWEDEWKRAGKKSCKKRDLPFILPHRDARTRQLFDRCLFGRHCDVYISREQSESRSERLTGFKCQLCYLEKRKSPFFSLLLLSLASDLQQICIDRYVWWKYLFLVSNFTKRVKRNIIKCILTMFI